MPFIRVSVWYFFAFTFDQHTIDFTRHCSFAVMNNSMLQLQTQ